MPGFEKNEKNEKSVNRGVVGGGEGDSPLLFFSFFFFLCVFGVYMYKLVSARANFCQIMLFLFL